MYNGAVNTSVNMLLVNNIDGSGSVIEFDHKMDADTINAGVFFEINIDND
jgi:hypothetical protein